MLQVRLAHRGLMTVSPSSGMRTGNTYPDVAKQTYVGAILSKVVDNVQIHVKSIHVRYEDGTSTPEHPFAAGLTIDEFKAVSTDEHWVEAFIQDSLKGVHKVRQNLLCV